MLGVWLVVSVTLSWSRLHMISRLLGKKPRLALSSSNPLSHRVGREGTLSQITQAMECWGGCEPDCPLLPLSYPEAGALADLEVCLASFKTFIIKLSFPWDFLGIWFSSCKSGGVDSALVLPPLASGPEGVCIDALLLFLAQSRFSVDTGFRWRYFQQVAENGVTWGWGWAVQTVILRELPWQTDVQIDYKRLCGS